MLKHLKQLTKQAIARLILVGLVLFATCHLFTGAAIALEVYDIPSLAEIETKNGQTWVIDGAGVLSTSTEAAATNQLKDLAKDTGLQVRFVTVDRIDFGQPVAQFTTELFDKWFPTDADKANQALLLIATEDHRTAFQIGDKVKALLNEEQAKSVALETMFVPTQKANYNQAVADGTNRLALILTGKPDPGPPAIVEEKGETSNYTKAEDTDIGGSTVLVIVLLIAATIIPMVTYYWFQNQS
ncbi:photosystem II repair protein Psb32 [Tumidithrix helvetica PCC 7403]|uniref:photosystem II repair protein Psb32 n=1 Tax=Tumidithrix helvetica TaxID=3457545 RepID=UPI003CB6356E